MSQPIISVIVPVYNVEQYLEKCILSLRKQTYKNLEIILIDDGSPDKSPAMCDNYATIDSRIKVIHKSNGGLADARNAGLEQATGEYVAFVDSDDWIMPSMYSDMMKMFRDNPELDIVCCAAARIRHSEEVERCFSYYGTGTIKSGVEITKRILLDDIGSQVVKGLYRYTCWDNVRFPIGLLYEDIPTTYKAFSRAKLVGFIDEPYYKYRMNDAGISNTAKAIKPYHIYLGFKSHYEFAKEAFPEIADRCCANAAHYAISTYFHYCSEKSEELESAIPDVRQYMDFHKPVILQDKKMPKSRKAALRIYYFSNTLFKFLCRTFHVFGLQKKLGFDMK